MPKTEITKVRVNVTLDKELVTAARAIEKINISAACEYGLRKIVEDCGKPQPDPPEEFVPVSFEDVKV